MIGAIDDGADAPILSAGSGNVVDSSIGAGSASLTFQTDGDRIATTISGGAVDEGDWITPKGIASTLNGQCTIRATYVSGALADGTFDTDLALSTERSWTLNQSEVGSSSAVMTFTMKFNGATIHTVNRTLTATAT